MKKKKIKTKNLIIFIICITLIVISITYGLTKANKSNEKKDINKKEPKVVEQKELTEMEKAKKELKYYKDENVKEYEEYRQKNPDLSIEKVITNVNIGLNNKYYTNTKPSKYLNTEKILVNKYNYVTEDYIPESLQIVSSKYSSKAVKLVSYAKEAFEKNSLLA